MKVLVTGANGHLGANLLAELLAAGHTVRGSVRSTRDRKRTAHLYQLGPVELVQADLDDPPSIRAAMDGMDAVLHAAAVYTLFAPGQEDAILRASVEGVRTALHAAKDANVKRVILTSSVVTLPLTLAGAPASDETMWATDLRVPYMRAKTEAEQLAWKLADDLDLDFASVLPGAFGGPGFQRNTPTIDFVESVMNGALQFGAPAINYPWVDVRDVARAHLLVLESGARGRYAAVNERHPTVAEIGTTMHAIDPSIPRPPWTFPSVMLPLVPMLEGFASRISGTQRSLSPEMAAVLQGHIWNISTAKIRRELGWEPRISIKQSLTDTIDTLRAQTI